MGRRDLHPGHGLQEPDGERDLGSGAQAVEQVRVYTVGREHLAGQLRKLPRLPAGLVADDDPGRLGGSAIVLNERAEALGGLPDSSSVDPIGARA